MLTDFAPDIAHGVPIGNDDWKLAVEIAFPAEGASLYDEALYDTGIYSDLVWTDVTPFVRGLSWLRGADAPGGRPSTGTATITIDNRSGDWYPWNNAYYQPGTLFRIVTFRSMDDDWVPQFCGPVEVWGTGSAGLNADKWITVQLTETVGVLGLIDNNALDTPEGAGETGGQRADRLLNAAVWQWGFNDEALSAIPVQSTEMSLNRLAELHLTADSTDTYFRSHRSGIAMLEQQDETMHPTSTPPNESRYGAAIYDTNEYSDPIQWATARTATYYYRRFEIRPDAPGIALPDANGRVLAQVVYDGDSVQASADPDILVNDARLANVGGVQKVGVDVVSQGKYGIRSYSRNDLITQSGSDVQVLADAIVARRANRSLQVSSARLHRLNGNGPAMWIIDVSDPVTVVLPDYKAVEGKVTGLEHNITAMTPNALLWTTTLRFETRPGFVEAAVIGGS